MFTPLSEPIAIGVIGGSGLYYMSDLVEIQEVMIDTPFGIPSDALITGKLKGVPVVFLARHGRGHRLLPSEVPYRANIYAMKRMGVRYLLSASAVGSLKESIAPLDLVIPHQFIDRTQRRISTFFGEGVVAHVSFAQPVCPVLARMMAEVASSLDPKINVHPGGTYVCMEGPAFSTQAESHLYRQWGASVIGMTNLTEAKLAREAEIAYTTLALVTDFDCWHPDHDSVTVEMVIDNLQRNAQTAQEVILSMVQRLHETQPSCLAHHALQQAIFTNLKMAPPETLKRLEAILHPYLG